MNFKMDDLASPAACLCFNLRRTARLLARELDAALQPSGITSAQFSILAVLKETGPLSIAGLAQALGIDRTTLTRNLALLERDGFVDFHPGEDRRSRLTGLNASGEKTYREALPLWRRFQDRKVAELGRGTAQQLLSLLASATR